MFRHLYGVKVYKNRVLLLLVVLLPLSPGCVRRRLTIRSDPPGALVFVDDQEIGRTPVSTSFVYYGTRKFRIMMDGYETITVNQPFPAPWYQIPPLDFVSENLYPREIRDERVVEFELVPKANVSMDEVLTQGDQLRELARPDALAPTNPGSYAPVGGPWTN
jgi:hypothetical protein